MNKRMYLGILAITFLPSFSGSSVKALEPISLAAGALATVGISKAIDGVAWLFSPSKSDEEYQRRHERLNLFTKKEFVEDIKAARTILQTTDLAILAQHELYRYQAFIDTIKEVCPDYAEYIKALMAELERNPQKRVVHGFETDHLYHKGAQFLKGKRAKDFSEFYELIKRLYAEILIQEQLLKTQPVIGTRHE